MEIHLPPLKILCTQSPVKGGSATVEGTYHKIEFGYVGSGSH
jgi:hypothetical protein